MIDVFIDILAVVPVFTFVAAVAFKLFVAYAAYWVASQFASPLKNKMPSISTYPLQSSMKGGAKSKTYGTDRVAGNLIWLGDLHPYTVKHESGGKGGGGEIVTKETRYKRSFLLSIGEGPAQVITAWKGKKEIPLSQFTWFDGSGNSSVLAMTGEDYGKYKHNALAFFDEYDLGGIEAIANFTFEISTVTGYKYTYICESTTVWGIPLGDVNMNLTFGAGAVVDEGGGIVSLACPGHPFVAGETISIKGTTNYELTHVLTTGTTADRLHFADAYNAETLDGTETVVKKIASLKTGPAYLVQASDGTLYYGHNLDYSANPDNYYVTRISPDGTITYDYDFLNVTWTAGSGRVCRGLALSDDDRYLYIWIIVDGATDWGYMNKFDLTTGDRVWYGSATWPSYDMAIDAEGNAYGARPNSRKTAKFDSATGAVTELTGHHGVYNLLVDDEIGILIGAGSSSGGKNLWVASLADPVNVQHEIMVGTVAISRGWIATYDGCIYVLGVAAGSGTYNLFKYSVPVTPAGVWDGSALTLQGTADGPADHAVGIYFDLWGNLVVVRQDWTTGVYDMFWYYDTALNYLGKAADVPRMLANWAPPAGGAWSGGNVVFSPGLRNDILDANPADIIYDIITHRRYGARLSPDYIDRPSFDACWQYWQAEGMLLSLTLDESRPWQDWVDYILSHCDGYRFKSGGKIHLGVLKNETPVTNLTDDDLVQPNPDAEVLPPKVKITPRPYSDTKNRIVVAWSNRDNKYDLDTATAPDAVDEARSGTLRKKTVKLLGIKSRAYAQRMAYRFLIDALYRFKVYTFTVGYNNQLLENGDVITLSDNHLLSSEKVRIMAVQEDRHGRGLDITAMDDYAEHYPSIDFTTQESLFALPAAIVLADASVNFREDTESAKLYLSMVPGNASANGWYVYRSYDDTSYDLVGRCGVDGVTGGDANSAGTIEGTLAAHGSFTWAPGESVLVDIGTVTDLPTSVGEDDFWHDRNLARIGAEIVAFKTATETATPGVWLISNLRRGLFGTEASAHTIGESFCTLIKDFTHSFEPVDVGQTLYFKVVTYYGDNIQSLADVSGFAVTVGGHYRRPGPASLLRLTSDENDGGSGEYSASSFTLYWNLGGLSSGYNYGTPGGVPWNNYLADPELQAVTLIFEQQDGTPIGQREIAVGNSATITKATDLGGFNPARIRVVPRRVLGSRLENSLLVDDGS